MIRILTDKRGVPVSSANRRSLERLEQACELFHGFYNDPLAVIDAALAEDPDLVMGHCLRAGLLATTTDKSLLGTMAQSVAAAELLASRANDRERCHVAALRAWIDGDLDRVSDHYSRVLIDYPRDLLALQFAHQRDYFAGQSALLRDRTARVLPAWDGDVPGYNFVLGMHAFGLEETGDYRRAEERGRVAVAIEPRDPWAIHAVAHVMEMQGRACEGIDWLARRQQDWAGDNGLAYHNWWHLALFHLERGDIAAALDLYDRSIRGTRSKAPMEMLDAAALLWRLHLRRVPVGNRWDELADAYETAAQDGHYAFNDMHAAMSFGAAGREAAARRLLAALERRAGAEDSNGQMTRQVGLPVCRALLAFARGQYAVAVDLLLRVRPIAYRFGGSHAQRDVLSLTLVEAALRGGQAQTARALASERLELKPASGFNRTLVERATRLAGELELA
ncbi:MAG: tetratricopeptide repeat protein [Alphaproteobacteria bacterium]|nr:tetratricopeptide repeat protein [Alphaproteobacteria bacterium]